MTKWMSLGMGAVCAVLATGCTDDIWAGAAVTAVDTASGIVSATVIETILTMLGLL
jgi:hypothetical protein